MERELSSAIVTNYFKSELTNIDMIGPPCNLSLLCFLTKFYGLLGQMKLKTYPFTVPSKRTFKLEQ